ncbi:MAG: hypothetical protein IJ231_02470, partial [Clostridia bacterium]|nr:hypothetical protein [Clostridia bacterium]
MLPYQEQYIQNTKEISRLKDSPNAPRESFEAWTRAREEREARIGALRRDNIRILNDALFPRLDDLHSASSGEIADLEAFAAALMDWKTNLDCGVYVLIH